MGEFCYHVFFYYKRWPACLDGQLALDTSSQNNQYEFQGGIYNQVIHKFNTLLQVILASLAISSARVMYNPMTKGTESVFHLINSASDPAPAWNVNSANAGFLTPRDVISTVNPIVYALSPAGRVAAAPPATVHHANGAIVPADTPQVKAAKAAFRQAGGVVSAATSGMSQGPPAIVSYANGAKTPADTPEVQAAKTSHNMKVQAAKSAFRHAGGNLVPTGDALIASVATPVSYVHAPTTLTQSPVVFARPLLTSAHSHVGGATAVRPLALVA